MPDPVERLIHDLRSERCPPRVMERVARRLGTQATVGTRGRRSWWAPFAIAAALTVLAVVGVLRWQGASGIPAVDETAAVPPPEDPAVVVHQAVGTLALVGQSLLQAASTTEQALLEEAAPPLLKSFHSAKSKLTAHP